MKTKIEPQMDDLAQCIGQIAKDRQKLARQAEQHFTIEVGAILKDQSCDPQRIERLLDGMLDFCFDAMILALYKKVCRYYFKIDPSATVSYIYAYRDLWDEDAEASKKV